MLRSFFSGTWILLLCAAVCCFTSCHENTIINANVTPAVDNIHTFGIGPEFNNGTDTMTILSRTVYYDSIITSFSNTGFAILHGLGNISGDPYFGRTNAAIYLQVVPSATSFRFSEDDVIDSAVVILPYSGFSFGDTTTPQPQTFRLHSIGEDLSKDSSYYAFQQKAVGTDEWGSVSLSNLLSLKDSVRIWDTARAPQLRIGLNNTGIDALKNAVATDTTYASFLSAFKGLYISADSTGGNTIPYFRLDGSGNYGQANILVYYHTGGTNPNDSETVSFAFNPSYAAHYNRITRNYAGTPSANLINGSDTSVVLLQNSPGAAIDISLPYLRNLPAAIINKAQLILTQISTDQDATYFPPSRIFVIGVNDDGTTYSIADRYPLTTSDGLDFIDGNSHTVTVGGVTLRQYVLNFPREAQHALTGTTAGLHLRIIGTATFPGAYRLVAGGRNNQLAPLQLNIVYSKK